MPGGNALRHVRQHDLGRAVTALQGIPIDGRKVHELAVTLWVKVKNVKQGPFDEQLPMLAITFYDEDRMQTGFTWVGPCADTFDCRK